MNLAFEIGEALYSVRRMQSDLKQRVVEFEREIRQQQITIDRLEMAHKWLSDAALKEQGGQ